MVVDVCRARLQKLIVSGVGGKDQFVFRITQFRETSEFRDFREGVTFSSAHSSDDELPSLWFDLGFVEFLKDNYSTLSLLSKISEHRSHSTWFGKNSGEF